MRILFFGTSDFVIPSLRALIDAGHDVAALVTRPDKPRGRRLKLSAPPAKIFALTKDIRVFQPVDASSAEAVNYYRKIGADLFVVISFGQLLKKEVLDMPGSFAVNVHASLLPKYRGAAPTNWAIINGDKKTGVTVMKMNELMDEGDIILKKEISIDLEDTNVTLTDKLSGLGAAALVEAIGIMGNHNSLKLQMQDSRNATYAPKLSKGDALILWQESASAIHNKVRGLIPWPGAHTIFDGKILKILKTDLCGKSSSNASVGEVIDIVKGKGIIVRTGSGDIAVQYLQLEGKKALDADSFIRGHRIERGYVFN